MEINSFQSEIDLLLRIKHEYSIDKSVTRDCTTKKSYYETCILDTIDRRLKFLLEKIYKELD